MTGSGNSGAADVQRNGETSGSSALEFPCRFPVKAMGLNADDFSQHVLQLLHAHSEHIEHDQLQQQTSRSGRYLSVTLVVQAQSQAQLDSIYRILSEDARVLVAL